MGKDIKIQLVFKEDAMMKFSSVDFVFYCHWSLLSERYALWRTASNSVFFLSSRIYWLTLSVVTKIHQAKNSLWPSQWAGTLLWSHKEYEGIAFNRSVVVFFFLYISLCISLSSKGSVFFQILRFCLLPQRGRHANISRKAVPPLALAEHLSL